VGFGFHGQQGAMGLSDYSGKIHPIVSPFKFNIENSKSRIQPGDTMVKNDKLVKSDSEAIKNKHRILL